jgi:nucleotide-binding universal stress UspA family protein
MPARLFIFIQMEFPWALGPADGRYLLRRASDGEPERVVVLGTMGAARATKRRGGTGRGRALLGARSLGPPATPEPAAVQTSRVTVIDPVPLSADHQAQAWLDELDRERDVRAATRVVNRVLHFQRVASANPYVHEVSPAQALVIRAGWGEGEQVADGRWLHARELAWDASGRRLVQLRRGGRAERSAALRPQERLARLMGAQATILLCEELALRARLDLEQERPVHAALELDRAYALALGELRDEQRQDLAIRVAELEQLRARVTEQAQTVLARSGEPVDEEILTHALERLQAALRARTATGV